MQEYLQWTDAALQLPGPSNSALEGKSKLHYLLIIHWTTLKIDTFNWTNFRNAAHQSHDDFPPNPLALTLVLLKLGHDQVHFWSASKLCIKKMNYFKRLNNLHLLLSLPPIKALEVLTCWLCPSIVTVLGSNWIKQDFVCRGPMKKIKKFKNMTTTKYLSTVQ